MAAAEEKNLLSELEVSDLSESSESIDLSCIHWGYLNCTLVTEQGKKAKDLVWYTYWVDLCCSTIRLYRDLSLPSGSADYPPPASVVGPTNENEKKQAFLVLKQGAVVTICDYEEEFKSRKRSRKDVVDGVPSRKNVFTLAIAPSIPNSPVYLFQAPSKGSMYRWISKIVEGIDNVDQPQNQSVSAPSVLNSAVNFLRGTAAYKKLKEAKIIAMEQRRYHVAPELRYPEKDDADSGMEADVEVSFTYERPPPNPKLERLKEQLRQATELLNQLQKEQETFLGSSEDWKLTKVSRFEATTKSNYYLIPGHKATLLPKGTKLTIFGQLPNKRWRCCAEVWKIEKPNGDENSGHSIMQSSGLAAENNDSGKPEIGPQDESTSPAENETADSVKSSTQILIGSVPTSLLLELDEEETAIVPDNEGTPLDSPVESREFPLYPSPPPSPYSKHRSNSSISGEEKSYGDRPSPRATRKFIPDEETSWPQDFSVPSPSSCRSSTTTSRSTTPSDTPEGSLNGSTERLNDLQDDQSADKRLNIQSVSTVVTEIVDSKEDMVSTKERTVSNISGSSDIPVTCIGSETEDDREITVNDVSSSPTQTPKLDPRIRNLISEDTGSNRLSPSPQNYSFQVTRKLRQRGISLIVGSSSSEDEDEEPDKNAGGSLSKVSYSKLDQEFKRFEAREPGARPFSAVVTSRKRASINLGPRTTNFSRRCVLNDALLSEYSTHSKSVNDNFHRSKTSSTIRNVGQSSALENTPPLNQKRLLQMRKPTGGGYGFTLQTYGIVQPGGETEFTTFVLAVEEDGPAYMAGLRPGDIVVEIEGESVENTEHKTVVSLIQEAPVTVRLVAVFVDAIRKMKLNTRMKLLKAELHDKEKQLEKLIEKEDEILKGRTVDLNSAELDALGSQHSSFLFTTEITSSFSKDTPIVHDSIYEYKQQPGDNKHHRVSLPDTTELKKGRITVTTGTQLLRSFATLPTNFAKRASTKLQKSIQKKRPPSNTFKSYLDLQEPSSSQESLSVGGSPLSASAENLKATHRSMDSLAPKISSKQKRPLSLPEDLGVPIYSRSSDRTEMSNRLDKSDNMQSGSSVQGGPWIERNYVPEVAVRPPTPPDQSLKSKLRSETESEPRVELDGSNFSFEAPTRTAAVTSGVEQTETVSQVPKTSTPLKITTEMKTTATTNEVRRSLPSEGAFRVNTVKSPYSKESTRSTQEQGQTITIKATVVASEVIVHQRATSIPDPSITETKTTGKQCRNDSPSRVADMLGKFEGQPQQTQVKRGKCDTSSTGANAVGRTEVKVDRGGPVAKVTDMLGLFESQTSESTDEDTHRQTKCPSRVTVVMDTVEATKHTKVPPPVSPKPNRNTNRQKTGQTTVVRESHSPGTQRATRYGSSPLHGEHSGAGRTKSYAMAMESAGNVPLIQDSKTKCKAESDA